jgi:hypothetical protein
VGEKRGKEEKKSRPISEFVRLRHKLKSSRNCKKNFMLFKCPLK